MADAPTQPNEVIPPAPAVPETPAEETVEQTFAQKLRAALGLAETATDEEVLGALSGMGDLQTQASGAEELQKQYDDLQAQYAELNKQQEDLYRQKQEADADEILKVYEGSFTDEASKAAIRNILLSDKEAGVAILNGLKKPETASDASKTTDTPPEPTHDLKKAEAAASETELADKISARAKELVKNSSPKISLTKAYQQAEAELKPKA